MSIAEQIRQRANGLLGAAVYTRLFDLARSSKGGVFVEIGTAHGAATIALALGARDCGRPFHIYTVDPFAGFSSRTAFGSVGDNLRIVRGAFEHFGVASDITVVIGTSRDLIGRLPTEGVGLLMIDADGRIDRDLAVLFDHLDSRAQIVLDDVDGDVHLTSYSGQLFCDQKHRITRLIVNSLLASGHLENEQIVEATGFYVRGQGAATDIETLALPAYRELVFADIGRLAVPKRSRGLRPWVKEVAPFAAPVYRRLKSLLQ